MKTEKPKKFINLEILIYIILTLYFLISLIQKGYKLSNDLIEYGELRNKRIPGIKEGWILSRPIDNSDIQWREFRNNILILTLAMIIFTILTNIVRKTSNKSIFILIIAYGIFIGYLHGIYIINLIIHVIINYKISEKASTMNYGQLIIWTYNCIILIIVRFTNGLSYTDIKILKWLDRYKGPMRWHICFNITILRCISYGIDIYNRKNPNKNYNQKDNLKEIDPNSHIKVLNDKYLELNAYDFKTYLCYMLYPSLYLAGPISTYNAFSYQFKLKFNNYQKTNKNIIIYGIRLIIAFIIIEILNHFIYANAIVKYNLWKNKNIFKKFDAFEISTIGFWVLIFTWLKFLVIWRYFRFFSMLNGIDVPENMCRCLCNNYNIQGFWKNWHTSYNIWLVRYIYIPLGGYKTQIWNIWIIFTFVALWHDIELKLIQWAWIMALFFILEIIGKWLYFRFFVRMENKIIFRYLYAMTVSINILMLMIANMIGFIIGLNNVKLLLNELILDPYFVFMIFLAFFSTTQIMFRIRDYESLINRRLCPLN